MAPTFWNRLLLFWRRYRSWLRPAGLLLGVGLFLAAVVVAVRGVRWEQVAAISPFSLLLITAAVVVNLLLTGLLFDRIIRGLDACPPVPAGRMLALITFSGLLNYIPILRPGLWGRALYLKRWHQLPLQQSLWSLVIVLTLSLATLVPAGVLMLLLPGGVGLAGVVALWCVMTLICGPVTRRLSGRCFPQAWLWVPLKVADLLVGVLRLQTAFWAVGVPLNFRSALIATAAAWLVRLSGITPNGLGLSAWVITALASATADIPPASAATAAIVERGVEGVVMLLGGFWAGFHLRRLPASGATVETPLPPGPGRL